MDLRFLFSSRFDLLFFFHPTFTWLFVLVLEGLPGCCSCRFGLLLLLMMGRRTRFHSRLEVDDVVLAV